MGCEDYEDEELDEEQEEDYNYDRTPVENRQPLTSQQRYDSGNVVSMQNRTVKALTSKFKLMVIEPKGFDECSKSVDS